MAGTAAHSMLPLDGAALRRLSPALHRAGAPLRLARGGGRQRRHRRRPGRRAHRRGRTDRDGLPGEAAGRAAPGPRRRARRHAAPAARDGGRLAPVGLRPRAGPLPLRARRVQGRLGPGRAGPVERRALPADRHRARGRDVRGDRPERGGRQRRPAPGPPVLPRHPALRGRPRPGAGRPAHACGPTATSPTDRRWT